MEELFADPETGMPSRALGLLGEKAMEERLNRLEDQVRPEILQWLSKKAGVETKQKSRVKEVSVTWLECYKVKIKQTWEVSKTLNQKH